MINFGRVSTKIFKILKGLGYQVKMYSDDGMEALDPEVSTRFFVIEPNLMITIDVEDEEIVLNKSSNTALEVYENVISRVKKVANEYMLNFTLREYEKSIQPKDFSYQTKIKESREMNITNDTKIHQTVDMEDFADVFIAWDYQGGDFVVLGLSEDGENFYSPEEVDQDWIEHAKDLLRAEVQVPVADGSLRESLSKMYGSTRTSKQTLENVQIIVKHKHPVNEESRGSRSRDIHSIYLESSAGRVQFPHNNLRGARAMARHMSYGGIFEDSVGKFIIENTGNLVRLKEFMRYVKSNSLINESSADVVSVVVENMSQINYDLEKLTGSKTYESVCARISESSDEMLSESDSDLDLKEMFTVKRFDEKYSDVLPIVNKMVKENSAFLRKIEESANGEISLRKEVGVSEAIQFASKKAELGNKIVELASRIIENEGLSKYVSKLGNKIIAEGDLSVFEHGILSKVLSNSKVQCEPAKTQHSMVAESISTYAIKLSTYERL